ncbi:MAG: class I SAM-dependent methyltransferase [Pyrinomonadaceae bacterium]
MLIEETLCSVPVTGINSDRIRVAIFDQLLQSEIPFKRGNTLVDLGAGHCFFSKKARDFGYSVTAVDARTVRRPQDLGTINFVQSDIRTFQIEDADVVLNLGLFYHLTISDQVDILRKCNRVPFTILETQVHDPDRVGDACGTREFSGMVNEEGFEGIYFGEVDNPMASFGNAQSFWHTHASMLRIIQRSGYSRVTVIEPSFMSKYGVRRYYLLQGQ